MTKPCFVFVRVVAKLLSLLTACSSVFSVAFGQEVLKQDETNTIYVINYLPVLGSGINIDKIPNKTSVLRSKDFSKHGTPSLTGALNDQVGSVGLSQSSGNPNQPDFEFRGFVASPVEGTPQGIAVYQDGVRLNEAFGDTVNWDLIPAFAIDTLDISSANPVYGFNALGGGIAIRMKDGFNYQHIGMEASDGSHNNRVGILQFGQAWDRFAFYIGIDAENDDGWRRANPSQIRKLHSDIGYRNGANNFHISFTGADNILTSGGPTPEPLLDHDRRAQLSLPQNVTNQLAMVNLRGNLELNKALSIQATLYSRNYNQSLTDGNPTTAVPCTTPLDPQTLCMTEEDTSSASQVQVLDQNNKAIPISAGGIYPGQIDSSRTSTKGVGATVQATWTESIASHQNHAVIGSSIDQANTKFRTDVEYGTFDGDSRYVTGSGLFMRGGQIGPVSLNTKNTYSGIYFTDTFDLNSYVSVSVSARYNDAILKMEDQLGNSLNGSHHYSRLNPSAGLSYRIFPWMTWYGNYAENNRIPTAAELSCADPSQGCTLANFFISDPELKQVVAKTFETGFRGTFPDDLFRLQWSLGAYRTDSFDDILQISSQTPGRGYFQNIGITRRQGIEARISYKRRDWLLYADYDYIEASFRSELVLDSPNNPAADKDGRIHVTPGKLLPGIPKERFKFGFDYSIFNPWSVGTVIIASASQFAQGDQSNQNPKIAGYTVVGIHTNYNLSKSLQFWATIENIFNRNYDTMGTFTDAEGVPINNLPGGSLGQTRSVAPGPPREAFAGLRYTF